MPQKKIRYAVVGLGHIAQNAVLPAFRHARNSELTALVSDDQEKLKVLGRRYGLSNLYNYDEYALCLASGAVDAVYIALPNNLHREYSVRASEAGVHVLCEKPMAMTEEECRDMIEAAKRSDTRLMVAYRLHFERANLKALDFVRKKKIGALRLFNSTFTMQVRKGNIRTEKKYGGGPVRDLGVYCINAARMFFADEPEEVYAVLTKSADKRFQEIEESASVVLRFPEDQAATFVCSFGAFDSAAYDVIGTEGSVRLDPGYEYSEPLAYTFKTRGHTVAKSLAKRDQFAAEIEYFSNCIVNGKEPEPSGREGLADVRVIEAIFESARAGRPVHLRPFDGGRPVSPQQIKDKPPVRKPELVKTQASHV